MRNCALALLLFVSLAAAQAAGAPQQPVDKLFAQLKAAETDADAKPLEAQILASFQRSG